MNKVSTKVEVRFVVSEAEWLPHDVRRRLARHEKGRINNKGELVITAQEFRQATYMCAFYVLSSVGPGTCTSRTSHAILCRSLLISFGGRHDMNNDVCPPDKVTDA